MPISITYLAIALLTYIGVDNAEEVTQAVITIAAALIGLYGRYRAGGLNVFGWRK